MHKKELWQRIARYNFADLVPTHFWDDIKAVFSGKHPFMIAFANKLARKNNWDKKFAMQAIWEYKKFVYLGVISSESVTPSKVIDQVWHEHLLFTVGYRKFCRDVLHYYFNHHPELIANDNQTENYEDQFIKTIALYKKEFGMEPPEEIWGKTKFSKKIASLGSDGDDTLSMPISDTYAGEDTLVSMFSAADSSESAFDGGTFSGGGADGGWDADASDSGGDSGSDGGSSCSSSCGGCGGGD